MIGLYIYSIIYFNYQKNNPSLKLNILLFFMYIEM